MKQSECGGFSFEDRCASHRFQSLFLVVLCVETQAAQGPRDDWRYLRSPAVLETHLDHSLTDAPLTAEERAHIYALVDSSYHDYFGDDHEKQRLAVLSSRVGTIVLTADRTHQILVRGPLEFCGGTGNCPFWILVRPHGKLRTVLAAEGKEILPRNIIYLVLKHHSACIVGKIPNIRGSIATSRNLTELILRSRW